MAAVMGIPKGTVKSRLSRGLARLRNQLGSTSFVGDPKAIDEPLKEGSHDA